jgi:flagellar FliJ protein
MPYHFKLETILNLRRNLEEQAQLRLAAEQRTLAGHTEKLDDLQRDRVLMINEMERRKKKKMTGAMFSLYMDGVINQDWRIQVQHNTIKAQEQVVEQARQALFSAVQQRKIMDKVKEKDFLQYRQEELRREQIDNDEQAVLRYKGTNAQL